MTRAEREAARLLEMIRKAGVPVPEGSVFHQTYASASMRNEGGAVWALNGPDGYQIGASQWPRRFLLTRGVEASLDRFGCWWIDPARL